MSKTQTSISRQSKGKEEEEVNLSAYVSPQILENVFNKYDIKAEIYRYVLILVQMTNSEKRTGRPMSNPASEDRGNSTLLSGIGW